MADDPRSIPLFCWLDGLFHTGASQFLVTPSTTIHELKEIIKQQGLYPGTDAADIYIWKVAITEAVARRLSVEQLGTTSLPASWTIEEAWSDEDLKKEAEVAAFVSTRPRESDGP